MIVESLNPANSPNNFGRQMLFYKPALERLGMTVTVRNVDDSQYENRARKWDYDMIVGSWAESLSPGNEQPEFWGSKAAADAGSRNPLRITNPPIPHLTTPATFPT